MATVPKQFSKKLNVPRSEKLGPLAFIMDARLPREKAGLLTRSINLMRTFAQVEVFRGDIDEKDFLKHLEKHSFQVILAPWYLYRNWTRVEAHLGRLRTSGSTFAGYFCEQVTPAELGEFPDLLRAILLDFAHLNSGEINRLIRALLVDTSRTGILPLVHPGTTVYHDKWHRGGSFGAWVDGVFSIPELKDRDWMDRPNTIRTILCALWSLIYDEGTGKKELSTGATQKTPIAFTQIAADEIGLFFRLCYAVPLWTPKKALETFMPDPTRPTAAAQLLLKYGDFLRVQTISETSDVELVVGLFKSAPADEVPNGVHTIWIDTSTGDLVTEGPRDEPRIDDVQYRILAKPLTQEEATASSAAASDPDPIGVDETYVREAAKKIGALKELLVERDRLIEELKSGGVSSGTLSAADKSRKALDYEELVNAFQERYFETRFQIRQFEVKITELEAQAIHGLGAEKLSEAQELKLAMDGLIQREEEWIKRMSTTLDVFARGRKKSA
jgi:hypothetical protein